jgi:predicted dehydrogenase
MAETSALLVCGDNAGKADIAEAAARRGLHVYQDKPMAATLAQADRILRAAESSGITLMVAYHSAFSPTYDRVKQLIGAGPGTHEVGGGSVYLARGVTGHAGPAEVGCSKYFCEWLFDPQRNGGGTFIDEACYLVDAFVDYLGGRHRGERLHGADGAPRLSAGGCGRPARRCPKAGSPSNSQPKPGVFARRPICGAGGLLASPRPATVAPEASSATSWTASSTGGRSRAPPARG